MNDTKIFRSTLFWIITVFFTIIIVLTILNIFFGIGKLNPEFQSKLFYAFLVEIAAAIFALFYALFGLKKEDNKQQPITPNKLSDIAPAKTDVSEKEIQIAAAANNDIYVGPDRSFQINQPPASWKIVETNYNDLVVGMRGIKNEAVIQQLKLNSGVNSDVIQFDSGHTFWIQPKPGQSIINESSILSALDFTFSNFLLIIPSEKYTAPTYLYTSVEKLLIQYLDQLQILPVFDIRKLSSGISKTGNRKIIELEAVQTLQNAIVNQNDFTYTELHHHLFGIEGEKKNYIIQLSYLKNTANNSEKFDEDEKILFDLVSSFKPLRANTKKEIDDQKANAEKQQIELNKYAGEQIFIREIVIVFSRITEDTFANKDQLKRLIKTLRQFQILSGLVTLNDKIKKDLNLDSLWLALEKAEQGNINELRNDVQRIIDEMNAAAAEKNEAILPAT